MASADANPQDSIPSEDAPLIPSAKSKALPVVEALNPEDVAKDEERVDLPQPWLLALLTVAMSAMTSITVAGSLFFLLAAPEKVSPHCYDRKELVVRGFCTASTVAFWTYPVVCCLFVVLVFAKNMIDQRTYYEFLLHKVIIGYGPAAQAWQQPTVLGLLIYAVMAFSALVWYHFSQTTVLVSHVYSSLAYITPIISFLAVIFTSWSIQGKLITLPNFMANYDWAMKHLKDCRCYPVEDLHFGYLCLEHAMEFSEETVDTPHIVSLVEYYTKHVQTATPREGPAADIEASPAPVEKLTIVDEMKKFKKAVSKELTEAESDLVTKAQFSKEWVYWEFRLLFNPRLQDERSRSFRNWALAYIVSVILAILLSAYIFAACLVTCLEIEKVLVPGTVAWTYCHPFSLRPDLGDTSQHKSLKQVAASITMSAIQTGTRQLYNRAPGGVLNFHIGAAA